MITKTEVLKDFDLLFEKVKDLLDKHTFHVVYNLKTGPDDQKDFFSKKELGEIKSMAEKSRACFKFIDDEKNFMDVVKSLSPEKDIVINLSRRGSKNNKKLLVSSLCDIYKIPIISSSGYTVNLCRNKIHFSNLLPAYLNTSLDTYYYKAKNREKIIDSLAGKKVIVKSQQSAGSLGLKEDACFILDSNHTIDGNSCDYIIQEYITGDEIEVPFFTLNDTIYVIGFFKITPPLGHHFLTEDISDTFNYTITKVSLAENKKEMILKTISKGVEEFYIEYYGRFDFIVNDQQVKLFDVATTPFFTNNTSFSIAMNNFKHTVLDVLTYISLSRLYPKIGNQ